MKSNLLFKFTLALSLTALTNVLRTEPLITAKTVALEAAGEYKSAVDQVLCSAKEAKGKITLDPNLIATIPRTGI